MDDMNLYLDIETIPDQREGALDEFLKEEIEIFKAPSKITIGQMATDLELDPDTYPSAAAWKEAWERDYKTKFCEQKAEEKWRKTALDGSKGEICVIGFAINDDKPQSVVNPSERGLLKEFIYQIDQAVKDNHDHHSNINIVGHKVLDFDLRFLFQRFVINGIKPSFEVNHSRYSNQVYDTMTKWAGFGNRISLDNLCKALGIDSPKGEICGANVWDHWLNGEYLKVANYCLDDVEAVRDCYKKMNFYK